MRARVVALTLAVGLVGTCAAPAAAGQHALLGTDPATGTDARPDVGAALGDAGTAAALTRLLAGSVPDSSLLPQAADLVSPTRSFEGGIGLSTVSVDTGAELPYERAIARAVPAGTALSARAPATGDSLVRTAPPSEAEPARGKLPPEEGPLAALMRTERLTGQVHARWSVDRGPCVGQVAKATTTSGPISLGAAVASLPDVPFTELGLPGRMPSGSIATLGGLLSGRAGEGPLVRVPRGLTTVATVDVLTAAKRPTVRATSRVEADRIDIFPGSPLAMTATVRNAPALTANSTGKPETSRIVHDTPVVEFKRGGRTLFRLDRTRPARDVPIAVPGRGFAQRGLTSQPIVDGYGVGTNGKPVRLSAANRSRVTELFVLRLSVGGLTTRSATLDEPFTGHQVTGSARLLDVQLLPTDALTDALERDHELPSTLAHFTLGEQAVRAAAPPSGARCGEPGAGEVTIAAPPDEIAPGRSSAPPIRVLLWGGAGLVLLGAYLLAVARPRKQD